MTMTIIHGAIVCKKCKSKLQPDTVGVRFEGKKLIRVCGICGFEEEVEK